MRPKFVFLLAIAMAAILGPVFYLKHHFAGSASVSISASPEPVVSAPAAITNVEPVVVQQLPVMTPESNPSVTTKAVLTPEQRQAAIDAETERLHELFVNNDPASLPPILVDLTNSEKEIRSAAIEAAKQFGSTNAIPALKAAADQTEDLAEKIAFLQAADFLTLPAMKVDGPPVVLTPEQIQVEAAKINRRHPQTQNPPPTTGD